MRNKKIMIVLCILFLFGCVDTGNLDGKFAYYFQLLNTSKDRKQISKARQEVEQLFLALEARKSKHLADFKFLLNSYRAAEITLVVDNPEEMQELIQLGLHPLSNVKFKKKHQKAEEPEFFSPMNPIHDFALERAFERSKKFVYSKGELTYKFSDLIDAWVKLKKLKTRSKILDKLAEDLQVGTCFGVSTYANSIVCKDPKLSPQKIVDKLDKNIDHVFALQMQQVISKKVYGKTGLEAAGILIEKYNSGRIKEYLQGFVLRSEVKFMMAKLFNNKIRIDRDFIARVVFSGDKSDHAVAIQRLEGGREYRLIDNNIGVLSFSTLEEFLEAFSTYRLVYYSGSTKPIMSVYGNYC